MVHGLPAEPTLIKNRFLAGIIQVFKHELQLGNGTPFYRKLRQFFASEEADVQRLGTLLQRSAYHFTMDKDLVSVVRRGRMAMS